MKLVAISANAFRGPGLKTAAFILVLVALTLLLRYRHWDFDDSFIVYRVVERIVSGLGWSYNNGETLNVSTSALNTIVVAALVKLGFTAPHAAHVVGFVGLLLCGWASFALFASLVAWPAALAMSSALMISLAGNMTWGLETHLFIGLAFVFMQMLARGSKWAFLVAGTLVLARPDGALFGLIWLFVAMANAAPARWPALLWKPVLQMGVVVVPWLVYSLITFDQLFPDTLSRKMWQARSGFWGSGNIYYQSLVNHLADSSVWGVSGPVLYFLVAAGLLLAIARRSPLVLLACFVALQQFAYVVLVVPGYHWYTAYLDAALLVFALLGAYYVLVLVSARVPAVRAEMDEAVRLVTEFMQRPLARMAGISAGLAIFAVVANAAYRQPETDLRTIAYRAAAQQVRALAPTARSFAAFEVGVFGYYLPNLNAVDLTGLTSTRGEFITGTRNDLFFSEPADVFIAYNPVTGFERSLFDDPRFDHVYRLAGRSETSGFNEISIYVRSPDAGPAPAFQQTSPGGCEKARLAAGTVHFDRFGGLRTLAHPQELVVRGETLSVSGWAVGPANTLLETQELVLSGSGSGQHFLPMNLHVREDLGAHFGSPALRAAGFRAWATLRDLPPGRYAVGVCGFSAGRPQLLSSNMVVVIPERRTP